MSLRTLRTFLSHSHPISIVIIALEMFSYFHLPLGRHWTRFCTSMWYRFCIWRFFFTHSKLKTWFSESSIALQCSDYHQIEREKKFCSVRRCSMLVIVVEMLRFKYRKPFDARFKLFMWYVEKFPVRWRCDNREWRLGDGRRDLCIHQIRSCGVVKRWKNISQ